MKVSGFVSLLTATALIVCSAPAAAIEPGDSALDQYVEQVPGVGGGKSVDRPDRGAGEKPRDPELRELASQGGDAREAAALAVVAAPVAGGGGDGSGPAGGGASPATAAGEIPAGTGGSPVSAVAGGAFGAGGGGGGAWNLLIAFVAGVVIALMAYHRLSRRGQPG